MGITRSSPKLASVAVALAALAACGDSSPTRPSLYVAVGTGGVTYHSTDGATWSASLSGTALNVNRVVWNGRAFAAVAVDGVLLSSTNGKDWTGTVYTGLNDMNGLAAHGGVFCAVGESGLFLRSENDGVDWTDSHVAGLTADLRAVAWTGSGFTAVGNGGVTATSPDCATWTQTATVAGGPLLLDVVGLGPNVVALGADGKVYASEDSGASWTGHAAGTGFTLWTSLATDGTTLYVAGFANMAGPRIASSTNLTDWTDSWSDSDPNHALFTIHWDGTRYVAGGANGFLVTSTDGTGKSWTPGAVATTAQSITGIAHR